MWNGTKWIVDTNGFAASISSGSLSGGQGLGKKNYIGNPNNATNWVTGGSSLTITTETTAANLPNQITQSTAIAFTRASGTTGYGGFRFEMDRADYSKPFEINIDQKSAFTTEGYQIQAWAGSVSGTYGTQLTVANASLSGLTGSHIARVDMPGSATPFIEFRIVATGSSGTAPFYANNIYFGPGLTSQSYAGSEWQNYIPTYSNSTNVTQNDCRWRRVGSSMEIHTNISWSGGAGAGGSFTVSIPSGFTMSTTNQDSANIIGKGIHFVGAGTSRYSISVSINSSTSFAFARSVGTSFAYNGTDFASSDRLSFNVLVPINEFAGNGIMNVGAGAQQSYYSFPITSDASTTTTNYGPSGSAFPSVGLSAGGRTATLTTQYPIQEGDLVLLEFQISGGKWQPLTTRNTGIDVDAYAYQNGIYYGVGVATTGSNTIVVSFGQYSANNSTFGAAGVAWTSVPSTARYRVRVVNASSPVGFGLAGTDGSSGLVNPYTEGSGVVYGATYTPTLTNVTNVAASTTKICTYTRVGKIVTVTGYILVDVTTTATASQIDISLPIASDLTVDTDLNGVASHAQASAAYATGRIVGDVTNNRANVLWYAGADGANREMSFTFTYIIK
jgi:hypothetical protein